MKTLFTNHRAFAVFNCKVNNSEKDALRLHVYNKVENKWVYSCNFIIAQQGIRLEDVVQLDYQDATVIVSIHLNGKLMQHRYNLDSKIYSNVLKSTRETVVPNISEFIGLKISDFAVRLQSIFKRPQLTA
jgi:hypothetical protein